MATKKQKVVLEIEVPEGEVLDTEALVEAVADKLDVGVRLKRDDDDDWADECDGEQQARMEGDFRDYETEGDSERDHGYAPEYMNRPGRWDR